MKKKRVLLITRYFPPLNCIATMRMYSWAKYFSKWGWEVDVLTTSKHRQISVPLELDTQFAHVFETPYFDPLAFFNWETKIKKEGIPKKGFKSWVKAWLVSFYRQRLNERMPGRTDAWLFPAINELKKRKKQGISYDFVISSYGPPPCHLIGYRAKQLFEARWLADYRDLWVENHIYKGLWPFTLMERILEKTYVSHADLLSTVSHALAAKLKEKFPFLPVHVIENGFDLNLMQKVQGHAFQGAPPKFRVLYTGSIYKGKRDPSPFFKGIKELESEGMLSPEKLEVLFYGASMGDLELLIEKYKVQEYAKIKGFVSPQRAYELQESANALLFLEDPHPAIDGNLTGKLFEYLYASPPILAIGIHRDMEAGKLIHKAHGGFICGQDVKVIKTCLLDLMHSQAPFQKNRQLISEYSRENQALKVMQLLSGKKPKKKIGV